MELGWSDTHKRNTKNQTDETVFKIIQSCYHPIHKEINIIITLLNQLGHLVYVLLQNGLDQFGAGHFLSQMDVTLTVSSDWILLCQITRPMLMYAVTEKNRVGSDNHSLKSTVTNDIVSVTGLFIISSVSGLLNSKKYQYTMVLWFGINYFGNIFMFWNNLIVIVEPTDRIT